ncbi:MAG: apolipoprotein N-acyltransferase [Simkania sp.]|nr:apolipoprotein N-acyltransferase [Simkania sp.]
MRVSNFFKVILSLLIVGLGQPAWISWIAPVAAALGYALFWDALKQFSLRKQHFWLSFSWFSIVQAIQLSWMTSIEFQGYYILVIYALLSCWLGLQFGLLSVFVLESPVLSVSRVLALAGVWTLMEWIRFHILCGFSWNPLGIALTSYALGMQLASVGGVLGLSFWVIMTNLFALRARTLVLSRKRVVVWAVVAMFPYLYSGMLFSWHSGKVNSQGTLQALLVQPGMLPSQKTPLEGRTKEFMSPWEQWRGIFQGLIPHQTRQVDLVALPESAVPFRSNQMVYDYHTARDLLAQEFGQEALKALPILAPPFFQEGKVSNAFFSQFLANHLHADIIIGMDDEDSMEHCYSAAMHFTPWKNEIDHYEKRVLLPLAEYIPFEWCATFTKAYGIESFYTHGKGAKVFSSPLPLSVSICYEETFPNLVREGRLMGARLFVNLTNDNWYPESRLAQQHFDHGKLRAVENGIPTVRACNSGITAAVDAFGRTVGRLTEAKGVLHVEVPKYQMATLYTITGDALIVGICFGFIAFYLSFKRFSDSV